MICKLLHRIYKYIIYMENIMNGDKNMKEKKDLKQIMYLMLGKEVDTNILLDLLSSYYNRSIETLSSVLNFKIIQYTHLKGTTYKGVINFEDESLIVDLSCAYNGHYPTYTVTNLC